MKQLFFWIIWDNRSLVEHGLKYLYAQSINYLDENIISFTTSYPERLESCAILIKYWILIKKQDIKNHLIKELIATNSKENAQQLKKEFSHIKRYKLVALNHTDQEIKDQGQELITIGKYYGIVQWYQNIPLYETIDFWKPISGMGVGMMPSKLALTLINIALGHTENTKWSVKKHNWDPTIWDPFCGFWTTNFLANALWYNTIWSDINPTPAKQNLKWRTTQVFASDCKLTLRKHDVTQAFEDPVYSYSTHIVSEWWLWPIVTKRTQIQEIQQSAQNVFQLYKSFFYNLLQVPLQASENTKRVVVMTIPVRIYHNYSISNTIVSSIQKLGRNSELLDDIYSRPQQVVGRQILIASK